MSDLIVAFGLALVLEGLLYAAFPDAAKRMLDERHTTLDALLSSDETVIFETLYNAPMIYLAAGWPRACVDHLHNMLKQDREQGLNNADFHRFAADVIRDLGGR